VIFWKDFVMDDILGPILAMPEERPVQDCEDGLDSFSQDSRYETRFGQPSDTRNGASGKQAAKAEIQETRQEPRPARMVGRSSHDSAQVDRTSAGSDRTAKIRLVGGEG
jgi:hypothetical protein